MTRQALPEVVEAAQRGDVDAFGELAVRFQDMAVALALGSLGNLAGAQDCAQEAFATAQARLSQLRDPAAFPAWFRRIVLSQVERARRRERLTVPLEATVPAAEPGPAEVIEAQATRRAVRAAVEALPVHERLVIALFYLGGYSQQEVATFLELPVSTVKKRAHDARRRMKGMVDHVESSLGDARPSRTSDFSEVVQLFAAIRAGDVDAARRVLNRRPDLVEAEEDWSPEEALATHLQFAGRATPLLRATERGDLAMVTALVSSGAAVDRACDCDVSESPLWNAAVSGSADIAEYLIAHGADPARAAGNGVTPLHVAAMRGSKELVGLLLASGASPDVEDHGGRTPIDWAVITGRTEVLELFEQRTVSLAPRLPPALAGPRTLIETGMKALDLLSPIPRGGLVRWDGSYGLGQMVLFAELITVLARPPARCVWVGFECDYLNLNELRQVLREAGVSGDVTLGLASERADEHQRRRRFEEQLGRLDRELDGGRETLVFVVERPGHAADVESALPRLRGRPALLVTVVISPTDRGAATADLGVPAGYDTRIALDRRRVCQGLYPAVHLTGSHSLALTPAVAGVRHCRVAAEARRYLMEYEVLDPTLAMPEPDTFEGDQHLVGRRSQLLHAYLSQPMHVAEPFVANPGTSVRLVDTIDDVEDILEGRLDHLDRAELFNRGNLET